MKNKSEITVSIDDKKGNTLHVYPGDKKTEVCFQISDEETNEFRTIIVNREQLLQVIESVRLLNMMQS